MEVGFLHETDNVFKLIKLKSEVAYKFNLLNYFFLDSFELKKVLLFLAINISFVKKMFLLLNI